MPQIVWPAVISAVGAGLIATGEVVKCKTGPNRCPGVKRDVIPGQVASANTGSFLPFSRIARRQEDDPTVGPCNVAQFEYDRCGADARAVIVTTSIPAVGVAQFDNVPATCMNLINTLAGGCGVEGPFPVVCGSACVKYEGLTEAQYVELAGYFLDAEA